MLNFHGLITAAMVLIVIGIIAMMHNKETHTTKTLMQIGIATMVVCYGLVWLWTIFSFFGSQQELSSPAYEDGTTVSAPLDFPAHIILANLKQLLRGIVIALPFIAVRLGYGVITFIDMINNKTDAKIVTSKPLKYALSAIPELIAIAVYCWVGIKTRHIKDAFKASKYTVVEGMQQGGNEGLNGGRVPLMNLPPQQEGVYEPYKQQYPAQTAF